MKTGNEDPKVLKAGDTIKSYVLRQNEMGINEWEEQIKKHKLEEYREIILDCAEHYGKITCDLSINPLHLFIKSVNLK